MLGGDDMNKITAIVLLTLFSFSAFAEEPAELHLKSRTTGRVLSLLPLNSPAIYYVKRPVRGTVYTLLEGCGIYFLVMGSGVLANVNHNDPKDWLGIHEISKAVGVSLVIIGSAMYLPPWLHTAVATTDYVDEENDKIRAKASAVSFAPLFENVDDTSFYGFQFQYKF